MNCQEMNHLLDAHAPEALTARQHEAIGMHLASCATCSEDWANWHEMAALPVPPTPLALRARIAAALSAQVATPARRAFRPYVVGGVLLAGAALAAAIGLQWSAPGEQPVPSAVAVAPAGVASPAMESLPAAQPAAASAVQPDAERDSGMASVAAATVKPAAANAPLDPHRIVVVKRPEAAADVQDIALLEQCHDALVRELRTLGGVNLVVDARVFTTTSFGELVELSTRDQQLARSLGAGKVMAVSTMNGCHSTLFDSQTRAMVQGAGGGGVDAQGARVEAFAKSMARTVHDKTLLDESAELAAARAIVLDSSRSDRERVAGLSVPVRLNLDRASPSLRGFFDRQVLAAIISLGTNSTDPEARLMTWSSVRKLREPALVQPLLQALAKDADAGVRYQAAFALHGLLDQPGVREALLKAAAEDPQDKPSVPCCLLTVRDAALWASVPNQDFRGWVRSRLFDESLSTRDRLLALQNSSPDGRFGLLKDTGEAGAQVVFDIGSRERDPQLRAMAWNTLWGSTPPAAMFIPVLIADLSNHSSDQVRLAAVQGLEGHIARADVRTAFERALQDPSLDVRRIAARALAAPGQ